MIIEDVCVCLGMGVGGEGGGGAGCADGAFFFSQILFPLTKKNDYFLHGRKANLFFLTNSKPYVFYVSTNYKNKLTDFQAQLGLRYEGGKSISNQPIPFPIDRDTQDFHALFQYIF